MKVTAFSYNWWEDRTHKLVVHVESDPDTLLKFGQYASKVLLVAINYVKDDQDQVINQAWADQLRASQSADLKPWLVPLPGQVGRFAVKEGVQLIFTDAGSETRNGYPVPHAAGPLQLQEE